MGVFVGKDFFFDRPIDPTAKARGITGESGNGKEVQTSANLIKNNSTNPI